MNEELKTLKSIQSFMVANAQLNKSILMELKKNTKEIQSIKSIMEERWQVLEE